MQVEQRLGGKLLDRPKSMPFQDGGANLCLCLEDVAQGWRCKPGANYQVTQSALLLINQYIFPEQVLVLIYSFSFV